MKSWLDKATAIGKNVGDSVQQTLAEAEKRGYSTYARESKDRVVKSASDLSKSASEAYNDIMKTEAGRQLSEASTYLSSRTRQISTRLSANIKEINAEGLTDEERIKRGIDSLSGKDRVGLFGEGFTTVIGAVGGAAASGAIASAAGASTLLGSSALGSALGGVFLTTTPVGWVVGSALVLGAAGYGAAKLVRSGSEQDKARAEIIKALEHRLADVTKTEQDGKSRLLELNQIAAVCVAGGILDQNRIDRMLTMIEAEKLEIDVAILRLTDMAAAAKLIELT